MRVLMYWRVWWQCSATCKEDETELIYLHYKKKLLQCGISSSHEKKKLQGFQLAHSKTTSSIAWEDGRGLRAHTSCTRSASSQDVVLLIILRVIHKPQFTTNTFHMKWKAQKCRELLHQRQETRNPPSIFVPAFGDHLQCFLQKFMVLY